VGVLDGYQAKNPAAANFRKDIQPLLTRYCADCHADGEHKGGVAFDELKTDEQLLGKRDLWLSALKNTRAGLMPPAKKARPTAEEQQKLENWIKRDAFGLDPLNPDPGRVTVRRLNRTEYRNTIRDLMGFDFKVEDELPPDDTGYGFDNIGDVLTVSPMLLEKYMQAAETIVAGAVPRVARTVPEQVIPSGAFRSLDGKRKAERISFYDAATLTNRVVATNAGSYRVVLDLEVAGEFDFDPGRCKVVLKVDDQEVWQQEYGWQNGKKFHPEIDQKWATGEHRLSLELQPLVPVAQKKNSLDLKVAAVRVQGPTEEHWAPAEEFRPFLYQGRAGEARRPPPIRARALEPLRHEGVPAAGGRPFPRTGWWRLPKPATRNPARASRTGSRRQWCPSWPRPAFCSAWNNRKPLAKGSKAAPLGLPIDEYALASRLSYFLWSTMPDAELFRLAERHECAANLNAQVKRMLADARGNALTENFWPMASGPRRRGHRHRRTGRALPRPGRREGTAGHPQALRGTARQIETHAGGGNGAHGAAGEIPPHVPPGRSRTGPRPAPGIAAGDGDVLRPHSQGRPQRAGADRRRLHVPQ
jgi:hypothetical protein